MKDVYCSVCHIKLEDRDMVVMDILNTLSHKHCYDGQVDIKDNDTFYTIKSKYDYYDELERKV